MGQVLTSDLGQNPARQARYTLAYQLIRPAYIINQVCGSGLRSIVAGYQSIISRSK